MKKILITGATGFIGNFLVDEALKRCYDVYVAVRKTSNRDYLASKKVQIVEFDFSSKISLHHLIYSLPNFDYVIHNAGVIKSLDKKTFFEVNYFNTIRLIEALVQLYKEPDKFIYISSLAAYGPGDKKTENPVLLSSKPRPVTSYGKSKLAAEKYIVEKTRIPYLILRPTAVYGPGEKNIFETIKFINKGIDFQFGTKNQQLTFIYVKDLVRLVFDAMESPVSNKAYFITDGNLYNSIDLGRHVSHRLNRRNLHIPVPIGFAKIIAAIYEIISKALKIPPVFNVEKVNELSAHNWNCDIQPIQSDFNFKAEYDLEKGMNETIDWYKKEGWLK
jgi:nucleoside-diphosphate-sugar epimerase